MKTRQKWATLKLYSKHFSCGIPALRYVYP